MTNRLAGESSAYLLQHKDNPVDWYPWGEEAFARARAEDKPIFLSIGYSSCHWCHVMEKESCEDAETAAFLNENFINVKVDREERPDVDSIYMRAVQGMIGQGGWPMSVFLTPEREPFYAGTYFPSRRQSGMPSFLDILAAVLEAYRERRDDVEEAGQKIVAYPKSQNFLPAAADSLSPNALNAAFRTLGAAFDSEHGGFGPSPKFPQPLVHEFLLRYWHRSGEVRAIAIAEITANKIARGGIYDQIGGGFHRYAVDAAWLIPHFEKMLYDNALLALLNLHMWQATGKGFFRSVVEETLAYVEREMLDPSGAFYSSQDADSEGEEGKFFVWDAAEVDALLGPKLSRVARVYFGITDAGNFNGRNVLSVQLNDDEAARMLDMPVEELCEAVKQARARLSEAREKRVRPGTDRKVVTAWNALMLKTFAEAGAALMNPAFVRIAQRNAEFILGSLLRDGRLLRTWKASVAGGAAKLDGYLEDYACL
ncbi:MAG: thioredoxin domain-containing protein, partial [Thermoanaerobaculia bacterium]